LIPFNGNVIADKYPSMNKRIIIAVISLFSYAINLQAQVKKSGAIQFETSFDPAAMAAANGIKLPEDVIARMPKASKTDFELLFTATNASYMRVDDLEDSNSGNAGGGMRFGGFGGGASHEYYYNFTDHSVTDVFDLSDTTYFLPSKLGVSNMPSLGMGGRGLISPPVVEITKTEETKKIIGFNCTKVIFKTTTKRKIMEEEKEITDVVNVWSTTELGFDFSPSLNYWTSGAVLAIEGKGTNVVATSIEYRNVSSKDVNLPKKGTSITADEYRKKIEQRMKGRGNRSGSGTGIRSITIN
jgi:GLPGLI family protein